jgi:hypothetical protein
MDVPATLGRILDTHRDQPGALLPVLHEVQEALGFIPPETVPEIAAALNLSRAEVHGVISYYHHFRQESPGRNVIRVCCAEGLPGRRRRGAGRTRAGAVGGQRADAGAGVLPGSVRLWAGGAG